jgi:hypothetical protein
MQRTRRSTLVALTIAGAAVLLAGCSGGTDFSDSDLFDQAGDLEADDLVDGGDDGSGLGDPSTVGALEAGAVTVFTEPGHAVVTVDGRTIDHTSAESGGMFRCVFDDDQISFEVNSEVGTMVLTASRVDDGWLGQFTTDSDEGGDDDWIQYSAQPFDGELGIDAESATLSYVGTAMRQDRNAMSDGDLDTPIVDVTVALNCGGEPAVVEVGGETFTFAPAGADSTTCEVLAPDAIDVVLNFLASEDRQLTVNVRPDGDGLIGGVMVIDGEDRWNAVISTQDGSADGLSVDGSTVTFTGTFEHTSNADPDLSEEFEGTATVTCPA